ncbi:MAG: ribonuclease P protein component [Mogibacterium sp.]|nr:ribonuclease P protein component [Mogibacterium sp.]
MRDHSELTLRKQSDFARVYKQGKSKGGRFAVILYRRNGLKYTRTAFVSSKKVGNSVERNRSRRLMKAAYRAVKTNVKSGYDIIFVARNAIIGCKEPEVEKQLKKSLESTGILTGNNNEK